MQNIKSSPWNHGRVDRSSVELTWKLRMRNMDPIERLGDVMTAAFYPSLHPTSACRCRIFTPYCTYVLPGARTSSLKTLRDLVTPELLVSQVLNHAFHTQRCGQRDSQTNSTQGGQQNPRRRRRPAVCCAPQPTAMDIYRFTRGSGSLQ